MRGSSVDAKSRVQAGTSGPLEIVENEDMRCGIAIVLFLSIHHLTAQESQHSQTALQSKHKALADALGNQLVTQIRRQTTPLGNAAASKYVDAIGSRLAAHMSDDPSNWTFMVIREHVGGQLFEPISAPGGYVWIPAALILAANNEAEFAGMLADAMAHVVEGHVLQTARSTQTATLSSIPLSFFCWSGTVETGGEGSRAYFVPYVVPASCLQYLREFELDADRFAARAMAAAGYDPEALLRYVSRLQPAGLDEEFSRLPARTLRISRLQQTIREVAGASEPRRTGNYAALQEEVRREITVPAPPIPSLLHPNR